MAKTSSLFNIIVVNAFSKKNHFFMYRDGWINGTYIFEKALKNGYNICQN